MPEITDPQVIAFSNGECRPFADRLVSTYWAAKELLSNYNAGNIGSLIDTGGAGNLIADGSEADGRTRIVGGDLYNLITAATAFVVFVEGGVVATADRLTVITKPHVNRI